MAHQLTTSYLADARSVFGTYKKLADGAMDQLDDAQLFERIDEESNSIAIIVNHLAGNIRSRWTDFLTTDGEKSARNRDSEFVDPVESRDRLRKNWEDSWAVLTATLASLTDADLSRTVTIRGEPHSVTQAIDRQMTHYAYHVGQIVFLAKHFKSSGWRSLSIPRNRSADANQRMAATQASQQ